MRVIVNTRQLSTIDQLSLFFCPTTTPCCSIHANEQNWKFPSDVVCIIAGLELSVWVTQQMQIPSLYFVQKIFILMLCLRLAEWVSFVEIPEPKIWIFLELFLVINCRSSHSTPGVWPPFSHLCLTLLVPPLSIINNCDSWRTFHS